ncbi:MAG TPA: phosphatidylglycerol lysyltransferase domain-containing protein [Anaerovoracaceae bacterium]|nr:phosphatidylglycerol lysyltransferase domain-containing protein [Anaerovoracaceae bacterium]
MEQFKKITVEDSDILAKYINICKHRACDYSVGNLVLWSDIYNTQFAVANDMLFIKFMNGDKNYFAFPMGNGDLKQSFQWILAYCEEQNTEFHMSVIESDMFAEIEKIYPGEYQVSYIRNNADYVYKIEDLKNLAGKKYHGKKNHINKFLKTNPDWSYERISEENTEECIAMVKEWCLENGCCNDQAKSDEICVVIKGLRNRQKLGLLGGIIRISGRIVALTMGEKLGDDTFVIHFEKAFADINGAYPMINQQFIIHELTDYIYINREEDLGVEGLRISKESYRPIFMVEKGILLFS